MQEEGELKPVRRKKKHSESFSQPGQNEKKTMNSEK